MSDLPVVTLTLDSLQAGLILQLLRRVSSGALHMANIDTKLFDKLKGCAGSTATPETMPVRYEIDSQENEGAYHAVHLETVGHVIFCNECYEGTDRICPFVLEDLGIDAEGKAVTL